MKSARQRLAEAQASQQNRTSVKAAVIVEEQSELASQAMDVFFAASPGSPQSQARPQLPETLRPFAWLYRLAVLQQLPADTATQVQALVEEAAEIVLGEKKGRMYASVLESHIEELTRLEAWWNEQTEDVSDLVDPFAGGIEDMALKGEEDATGTTEPRRFSQDV